LAFVSIRLWVYGVVAGLTQRVAAAQLRLLLVLALELLADAVEQLNVALVGVLAQRCDESPGHGARRFATDRCVGPACR
jgi:hypothetical protein